MGSLIASSVIGRTAMAIDVCTAADIVGQEGGSCPNNADPCTITKAYVVGDNCVIDFGSRTVTLSGVLDVNSGSMTFKGGTLTIASTGIIDGRGNGVAPATDTGGQVCIETSGSVNVRR